MDGQYNLQHLIKLCCFHYEDAADKDLMLLLIIAAKGIDLYSNVRKPRTDEHAKLLSLNLEPSLAVKIANLVVSDAKRFYKTLETSDDVYDTTFAIAAEHFAHDNNNRNSTIDFCRRVRNALRSSDLLTFELK